MREGEKEYMKMKNKYVKKKMRSGKYFFCKNKSL